MPFSRRAFLLGAAGAAVLSRRRAGASALPEPDWPAHGWGPEQTRHNVFETRLGPERVGRLGLLWKHDAGAGITGTPAVVGEQLVVGDWNGTIWSLDRRTGAVGWKYESGARVYPPSRRLGVFAGPAIHGDAVVVASDRLFALDRRSGKLLWETTIGEPGESLEYFWAPPLVHEGRVYAGVSAGSETVTRGRIVCLDARTGAVLWTFFTVEEDVAGGALIAPPSFDVATGVLYAATGNPFHERPGPMKWAASLVALSASTGRFLWGDQVHPHDVENLDLNCPPMLLRLDDGMVRRKLLVTAGKDGMRAWDRTTRQRLWHVKLTHAISPGNDEALATNGPEAGPTAAAGGLVFFASNDHDAENCELAAVRALTGEIVWQQTLPAYQFGPISVASGVVWIGLVDGKLRAFRAIDGQPIWVSENLDPIAGGPTIAHGTVFVGSGAGEFLPGRHLYAFAPVFRGTGGTDS